MAVGIYDRVRETTTVAGTGTATLLGAVTGYQSFSVVGNGNTTFYCIVNTGTTEWEVGIGTYTSSGTTLARTTVLASSNAGSLVTFSAGTKDVFVTYPAGYTAYSSNNASQTSGQLLTSNGVGVAPSWQAAPAAAASALTGTTLASSVITSSLTSVGSLGSTQISSLGVGTAASGTAGEIRATNNVTAYYSSDRQFKENIQPIENALYKVNAIGGKTFDWTDAYLETHGGEDGYFVQRSDFGVIAQDVQAVFPEAVRNREDGTLAVDYSKLVSLAFQAIVELKAEIELLKVK
jgi:hypothetical protein